MSPTAQGMYIEERNCPFCGRSIPSKLNHCPFCREAIPVVKVSSSASSSEGSRQIRRGLLYMLMAGIIYYFAGGYSDWKPPIPIPAFVNQYLCPLLFLGGAGMALYGLYLKMKT